MCQNIPSLSNANQTGEFGLKKIQRKNFSTMSLSCTIFDVGVDELTLLDQACFAADAALSTLAMQERPYVVGPGFLQRWQCLVELK